MYEMQFVEKKLKSFQRAIHQYMLRTSEMGLIISQGGIYSTEIIRVGHKVLCTIMFNDSVSNR